MRARPILERGWRYTLVGLFCVIANNAILIAVDLAGGHYLLGTVVAFLVVTPTAYGLHTYFTFKSEPSIRAFVRFSATVATTYPIIILMLALLCSGLRLPVTIAAPIASAVMFLWNFVAAHWAILPRFYISSELAPPIHGHNR
jgi:putative flippase GtrA